MNALKPLINSRELSHEIRISLTGILGLAELLNHDSNLDSEQHDQLNMIQQSGYRLLDVANQILELVFKIEEPSE